MNQYNRQPKTRINHQIKASELRVLSEDGENLGVLALQEALEKASEAGSDLIEISPNATPPVAKIMDYGKFQYDQKKKQKQAKAKSHTTETKTIQVKPGTGEHDLELKAKRASTWLQEGHRIKFDLYLRGRAKYMDKEFLTGRMERMLKLLSVEYKVAEEAKKSPKGLTMIIEKP